MFPAQEFWEQTSARRWMMPVMTFEEINKANEHLGIDPQIAARALQNQWRDCQVTYKALDISNRRLSSDDTQISLSMFEHSHILSALGSQLPS